MGHLICGCSPVSYIPLAMSATRLLLRLLLRTQARPHHAPELYSSTILKSARNMGKNRSINSALSRTSCGVPPS